MGCADPPGTFFFIGARRRQNTAQTTLYMCARTSAAFSSALFNVWRLSNTSFMARAILREIPLFRKELSRNLCRRAALASEAKRSVGKSGPFIPRIASAHAGDDGDAPADRPLRESLA